MSRQGGPDPGVVHPVTGQERVVFLKPLVQEPNAIVAGNPARIVRHRYDDAEVHVLLRAAWRDWPIEAVTEHARAIMSGTPADLERIAPASGDLAAGRALPCGS